MRPQRPSLHVARLALAALLVAAAVVGSARAGLFAVLPSADAPNPPGAATLSPALLAPPAQRAQRSADQLARLWRSAGDTYGVPWHVLAAINAVESDFGRTMGPSSAGALGWMQFMPATWERWGVDADGDGVASPWQPEDAVYAAARYLAASGARGDDAASLGRAVFAYNHAGWYVDQVLALSAVYARGGTELAFGLDRLAQLLAQARARLAAAAEELDAARAGRTLAVAGRASGAAGAAARAHADRLAALQSRVEEARAQVQALEARAAGAAFSPATGAAVGGPQLHGGYAFPVGGGAVAVSVARGHHDYPAADIAAPAGSPVYALAPGTVERAWPAGDPRCGIGLLLRAADGRGWVYCHLSLLDPSVAAGARVGAGAPLGLVGSTGDATGPHLHLQLQDASALPQDEPWFASFAGSAFRWREAAPAALLGGFAVVGGPVDVVIARG